MSTFKVTAEQVTIRPHSNADRLELAWVGGLNGYAAVVPKGVYHDNDWVLYIPEAGVLPDSLIEELGLVGKLAGKEKNRVKTVRLRGEISQGIVCRPSAALDGLPFHWDDDPVIAAAWSERYAEGYDFAPLLGIEKYVPPIPTHMSGEIEPATDLIRWIDIENIQRYPGIFSSGEDVVASEKIHGTACLYTYIGDENRPYVSSKGFGSQYQALKYDDKNLYWRAVEANNLQELAERYLATVPHATAVGIFGEVYGRGVQDLTYGADASSNLTLGYRVFDIAVLVHGERVWMPQYSMYYECASFGISTVPQLYAGPYDFETLFSIAQGTSTLADHVREGIVVRAAPERRSDVLGGRAIGKIINPDYLTRKGGTEYE